MCGKPHPEGFRTVLHPDRVCRAAFWIQTAVYRRRRGPNGNQVFSVTLRRRRHDLKKAQLPVPPQKPIRAVPALPAYAYQEASSLVLAMLDDSLVAQRVIGLENQQVVGPAR